MTPLAHMDVSNTWYDRVGKLLVPIAALLAILMTLGTAYVASVGGITFGSKVATDALAAATKAHDDLITQQINGMVEKVTNLDSNMSKIKDKLDSVPLTARDVADQALHLSHIDTDIRTLNDRITNVSQSVNDRITNDEIKASNLEGRLNKYLSPGDVRQPGH
jgi:hypothetical protein